MNSTKIVIVVGKKSHGPPGNGVHDYPLFAAAIKRGLEEAANLAPLDVDVIEGWPGDDSWFAAADSIVFVCDGQDGDVCGEPVPFTTSPGRRAQIRRQIDRGCGFVTFHFSTFLPNDVGEEALDWNGGYYQWQNEAGDREWYSSIKWLDGAVVLPRPEHELASGLLPFTFHEEYYYNIRFNDSHPGLVPVWAVPGLPGLKGPLGDVVSWGFERDDGGRGFATTCGHDIGKFASDQFRKMLFNGIIWSAGVEVPEGGVDSPYVPVGLPEQEKAL